SLLFCLYIWHPPSSTLFPYTTLFRSMLDYAGRVADYLEFAELLTVDALHRNESCGGHFREEYQTPDGEARRDDEHFSYVAAWERSEEHTSELQSRFDLVCRLLLEKKN